MQSTIPAARRRIIQLPPILRFARNPLQFLSDTAQTYGDVADLQLGKQHTVLLFHPDAIRDMLVTQSRYFVKGRALDRTKRLLGEGLLTSSGEHHRRQRRLAQPAFHRKRIAAYAETMVRYTEEQIADWQPNQQRDINHEMMQLTLRIAGQTLFGAETQANAGHVANAMHHLMQMFTLTPRPFENLLMKLPLPSTLRFRQARASLDAIVYEMIAARRTAGDDRGDLLSMLLLAQDEEGDGGGMNDIQLRDEVLTIFLAGHETTANALSWSLYLLAQHPDVADQLAHEAQTVLGDRSATVDDLPNLRYAEMVFAEALRLYPPAWILGRRAIEPVTIAGRTLPPDTIVIASQWVTHRDPRFFPDPLRFDPQRWTPEARTERPKFAYFPFGGGPRLCIGESFAWMEGTLVLASIARRWRTTLLPQHRVQLQPSITLRPRNGLLLRLIPQPNMV